MMMMMIKNQVIKFQVGLISHNLLPNLLIFLLLLVPLLLLPDCWLLCWSLLLFTINQANYICCLLHQLIKLLLFDQQFLNLVTLRMDFNSATVSLLSLSPSSVSSFWSSSSSSSPSCSSSFSPLPSDLRHHRLNQLCNLKCNQENQWNEKPKTQRFPIQTQFQTLFHHYHHPHSSISTINSTNGSNTWNTTFSTFKLDSSLIPNHQPDKMLLINVKKMTKRRNPNLINNNNYVKMITMITIIISHP